MTSKERMINLFGGKETDVLPAVSPYSYLSNADHWVNYTGKPVYEFYKWLWEEPQEHIKAYKRFNEQVPYDWMEPYEIPDADVSANMEIKFQGDKPFMHNRKTGELEPVPPSIHDAGSGGSPNETRLIQTKDDIPKHVKVTPAEMQLARADGVMRKAFAECYGKDHFILGGGVVNTFYSCTYHIGMTNLFYLMKDEEDFILELEKRILEYNIEKIRYFAMTGADAIYIDDATATNDMISIEDYEKFSLPFMTEQIKEIKRLGKKAIVIYFGGVSDRLDQILSYEPDGLIMEASMKGYINDVELAAKKSKGKCVIFGNLNPVDLEKNDSQWLENEIKKQADLVKPYAGHAASTGSPITPGTGLKRMKEFTDIAHGLRHG